MCNAALYPILCFDPEPEQASVPLSLISKILRLTADIDYSFYYFQHLESHDSEESYK
jgi:hypothetical protein